MNTCIIGLGRIGLTLSLALADQGEKVYGVDNNKKIVSTLKSGNLTIHEKGLDSLLEKHLGNNFCVSEKIPSKNFDVFVICINTPIDKKNTPKMKNLQRLSEKIGVLLQCKQLVILRSTVPIGATRNVVLPILEEKSGLKAGKDFDVVFSPERLVEGKALSEIRTIPQIIGGSSEQGINLAIDFFKKITNSVIPVSNLEMAEMIKLIDNTYRDVHFAFANQIALLCEMLGLNALECIQKANYQYPRNNIPVPSPGVGGPCITKDPHILSYVAKQIGYKPDIIIQSRKLNEFIPKYLSSRIINFFDSTKKELKDTKIFVIGFAYKGNPATDDTRNSSTITLINELKKRIPSVYGYDPIVNDDKIKKMGAIPTSIDKGFENSDCIIFMNNHNSYHDLDIKKLLMKSAKPCIFFDNWSMFKEVAEEKEIIYSGIGVNSLSDYQSREGGLFFKIPHFQKKIEK